MIFSFWRYVYIFGLLKSGHHVLANFFSSHTTPLSLFIHHYRTTMPPKKKKKQKKSATNSYSLPSVKDISVWGKHSDNKEWHAKLINSCESGEVERLATTDGTLNIINCNPSKKYNQQPVHNMCVHCLFTFTGWSGAPQHVKTCPYWMKKRNKIPLKKHYIFQRESFCNIPMIPNQLSRR